MKRDGGNERFELIMDDSHDRGVEGHADSQKSGPVSHLLQSITKILDRLGLAAQNDLAR